MATCVVGGLQLKQQNAACSWQHDKVKTLQIGQHLLCYGHFSKHLPHPQTFLPKRRCRRLSKTSVHRGTGGHFRNRGLSDDTAFRLYPESSDSSQRDSGGPHEQLKAGSQEEKRGLGRLRSAGEQQQGEGDFRWIILKLAGGCLLAAVLTVISLRRLPSSKTQVLQNSHLSVTSQALSKVTSPQRRSEMHTKEEGNHHKDHSVRNFDKGDSESMPYGSQPEVVELMQAAGLVLEAEELLRQERLDSGAQAGPSGGVHAPIIEFVGDPSTVQNGPSLSDCRTESHLKEISRASLDAEEKSDFQTSDLSFGAESAVSQDLPALIPAAYSSPFRTKPVWDSGIEPGRTPFSDTSPSITEQNDPLATRAVWDSGFHPGKASSIPQEETTSQQRATSKPKSRVSRLSGVQFCSFGQRKGNSFVRAAVEKVGPSVVRLNTERSPLSEKSGRDLFTKFFGGEDLILEEKPKDREQGQGSGFVVDGRRGIIATNAHVINRADTVLVTFTDGRTYKGAVIGTDELTDLAVIKVDLRPGEVLPNAPLGNSNSLEVGDWVIAVGNPFGLDSTVTLGILSSLHRQAAEIGIPEKRVDFLQTDCAINPGNSGGPLLNEFGEVVGINTAIRADAEGISFAIPINYARKVIDVLSQGVPMRHAYIGVHVVTITPELARRHNSEPGSKGLVPEARGILVVKVADGSPSEAAGLMSGDVILEMNGRLLRSAGELQCHVAYSDVGQVIKVKARRGSQDIVLDIVAGDLTPLLSSGKASRA